MNSVLNPEAPEFYPHLTSVTKDGYSTVNKTIKSSTQLPKGASYDLFKTFTDFNVVKNQLSENVITQSNHILVTELPTVKLKPNEIDHNTDVLVDANDSMLDRVNINIDSVVGVNKPSDTFLKGVKQGNVSAWNNAPVIAKIQVGSTMLIGAKNIPRPQLMFKDTIDNSDNLWVPKISDKPNNIKPLALNILYNDDGEAVGFEHPYKVELDLYHPPSMFIESDSEPPTFPPPLEKTNLTYIETELQMDELVKHLDTVKEFAVDVEHHSYRTYQVKQLPLLNSLLKPQGVRHHHNLPDNETMTRSSGITCLIQITTTEGGDFIIDALAVREHVHKLNQSFTDPKKVKIFHGAEKDVVWLQRDFGVYIVGLFDTHQAAKALQQTGLSLKHLLIRYCDVAADKKYQLADWRIRPLPEELIEYARTDTHYLIYIWRQMKKDLLDKASGQTQLLLSVFEQSRQICSSTYNKEMIHENSHMPLYVRSKKNFNSRQMAALNMLYKWRDSQARELDESTTYLLPNHMLLTLAETLPREVQGVNACCNPMPPFVKQNLITIHRMILSCRELPVEPQLYQMPASINSMVAASHQLHTYGIHDLTHYQDFGEDPQINLDQAAVFLEEFHNFQPDINAFVPNDSSETYHGIVSDLNADAKLFIPPYDRYRKYRSLAQVEEIKEFKDKEAKIAAIGKDNELIKKEVLVKLQQAKTQIEIKHPDSNAIVDLTDLDNNKSNSNSGLLRKRKISNEKVERKESIITQNNKKETKPNNNNKNSKDVVDRKVFDYKNVNYKKFHVESEKTHKHPKMKFKKHK